MKERSKNFEFYIIRNNQCLHLRTIPAGHLSSIPYSNMEMLTEILPLNIYCYYSHLIKLYRRMK